MTCDPVPGPSVPLPAPSGAEPPLEVWRIVLVRGLTPWLALRSRLEELFAADLGRVVIDEVGFRELLTLPEWDSDAGFATSQVALEAGRAILRRKPSLLVLATGSGRRRPPMPRTTCARQVLEKKVSV